VAKRHNAIATLASTEIGLRKRVFFLINECRSSLHTSVVSFVFGISSSAAGTISGGTSTNLVSVISVSGVPFKYLLLKKFILKTS
jgi:hypothetical protein